MKKTKQPGKGRMVWGIILIIIGFSDLYGAVIAKSSGLVMVCVAMAICGVLLIVSYIYSCSKYSETQEYKNKQIQELQAANEERIRKAKEAEERRSRQREEAVTICPRCGAASKGDFCDYCGYFK